MATCPTKTAQYFEEIKTFTFRGTDGINIPKSVRKEAYTLAVDIVIRSIIKHSYLNYECTPAEGYFGNATLVMQDCLELKIPVRFPRQRIYYGRVPEAFSQWNEVVNFEYFRAYILAVGESLQSLGTALGAGSIPSLFCCSLPLPSWKELPLREVYFHPPFGTQWEIEVSWIRPVAFSDACQTFFDGNSQQVDGDKDGGLPGNGIFPNIAASQANPFAGLPPVTPDSQQLEFSNSKAGDTNRIDPENVPPDDPYNGAAQDGNVYWLKWTGVTSRPEYPGGCGGQRRRVTYVEQLLNKDVRVEELRTRGQPFDNGCGTMITEYEYRLTGGQFQNNDRSDTTPTYEYKTGTTITDGTVVEFF
jgi:hypothetical protein